ncbi:hypothetical protein BCR42DRAFT_495517 [Absidia repens]|uniref:Uncharacterized protein n=1 Tax=Absidia repens TaxID=90262 RepID=A0A1X2I3D4_9FUNG|nr:hypothetical protein BCR42DRAFT_495517 [Absidia repens]
MYLTLPTRQERLQQKQQKQQLQQLCPKETNLRNVLTEDSSSSANSTATLTTTATCSSSISPSPSSSSSNMNFLTDERLLEIVGNIEDHRQSPPILTPTTLAVIFDNNNLSDDISPKLRLAATTTTTPTISEKDAISITSLQCFLYQIQKTVSHYIPSLEKAIKDDDLLSGIHENDTTISPLCALDHLTQILATFNQTTPNPPAATSKNQAHQ